MKSMKEIIVGQLEKGPETMEEIKYAKKIGDDFILQKGQTDSVLKSIHKESLKLVVSEVIDSTEETKIIRFVSEDGHLPVFEAGQYINLFVNIDGVRTSRPYSIASSPKQRGYYEICVAKLPKGGFVSNYFVDEVKAGDKFEANGPQGVFRFNPIFHSKKSVFLAGGSGITPFMSMSREALDSGADREITLIYGVRNADLAIYHKELENMAKMHKNFKYELVLSEPKDENSSYRKGFISADCIKDIVGDDIHNSTFYMCGPPVMTDFCAKALADLKVNPKDVRREMFGARQDIQNEPGWPSNLTGDEVFKVKVEGKVIDAKANESLLTSLERAGIRVNVCCRSGECSFCRVKLISGNVFIPRGALLRYTDEKFGYIHSCKAYPMEDLEIAY